MQKSAYAIIITIITLSIFTTTSLVNADTNVSAHLSTYGTIEQSLSVKTLSWADGSSESLKIDKFGNIFLNNTRTVAFGLHIVTVNATTRDITVPKILATLENAGVRFMNLDVSSWLTVNQGISWINYWLPKLYEHKMWVILNIQESPTPPLLDASQQYSRVAAIIDGIIDSTYAKMIIAVGYNWELDDYRFTENQVNDYLAQLYPLIKAKIQSSEVGNVPLLGKNSAASSDTGTTAIVKNSDIPSWDFYFKLDSTEGWKNHCDSRLTAFEKTKEGSGKGTMQNWFGENGAVLTVNKGANDQYSVEMFKYLYENGGINGKTAALFLWVLQWDYMSYGFAAFDMNGDPTPWFSSIINYLSAK